MTNLGQVPIIHAIETHSHIAGGGVVPLLVIWASIFDMQFLAHTHDDAGDGDPIVCHCLKVSESTLRDAIAICGAASVRELCRDTGAGGGCTACHARIRELLRHAHEPVPAC